MPTPRTALRYVESSISSYHRRVIILSNLFYMTSVFGLALAVAPAIIYASLQTGKSQTDPSTYTLLVMSTVIVSSTASFVTALLSFFQVRKKLSEAKLTYYGMVADYTLFKAGSFNEKKDPHLVLMAKVNERMNLRDGKSYAPQRKKGIANARL